MVKDELIARLKRCEWNDVEFKRAQRDVPNDAYTTVSAFSNTAGGWLVFGVKDTNGQLEIVGVIEVDKVQNDFLSCLRTTDKLNCLIDAQEDMVEHDGKTLLVFYVPEACRHDKPVYLNRDIRVAVHWGMTMAVYPFFSAVAEIVGRLVRLQGTCAAAHVQRRVCEQLGERETVARAARRILRCFVDWGVMQETQKKGVYQAAPVRAVLDKQLAAWLTEATLIASGSDTSALKTLAQTPALFPFSLVPLYAADLECHDRLELFRQSLDEDMVALRGNGTLI